MNQPHDDGLVEAELSPITKVRLKKLNGLEARKADLLCENVAFQTQTRALCCVREVNGEKFGMPISSADLDRVAKRFDVSEYDMLVLRYVENFVSAELEETAKKLAARQSQ